MKTCCMVIAFCAVFYACGTNQTIEESQSENLTTEFNESHRLQFHFTPPSGWMNDPNGMVYHNGEYHLFYQHNPDSTVWGPMHWGHAVSEDLVHWTHLPIALYPDTLGTIFSGSAVVDTQNTSGLGTAEIPAMITIFTYHSAEKEQQGRDDFQTQGIAYSLDNGRTWTKYEGNPVLPNPGIRDFRDPKVSWYQEGQKWVMALAVQDRISFYSSPNLIDWEYESDFGQGIGAHGGVWECPDLFPLAVDGTNEQKWVLLVSINPGGPNGGSATQYFVGNFDGTEFVLDSEFEAGLDKEGIWVDYGRDNYAGVTWANIPEEDGRRLFMGWMSNWDYANVVPTEKWRSAMTVARTLSLVNTAEGYRVISEPVKEIENIYGEQHSLEAQQVTGVLDIANELPFTTSTYELELDLEAANAGTAFALELSNAHGQKMIIGYDPQKEMYYTDRRQAGDNTFSNEFGGIHYAPRIAEGPQHSIRLLVDVASSELFADGGKTVMTDIFFPDEAFTKLSLRTEGGELKINSGTVTELKSVWDASL